LITIKRRREDSYDRLLDENKQFRSDSESVEDLVVKAVMIEKMMRFLNALPKRERELINALFFQEKSEHQLSAEMGIPRMTIHDRKIKILGKLKKLLEK